MLCFSFLLYQLFRIPIVLLEALEGIIYSNTTVPSRNIRRSIDCLRCIFNIVTNTIYNFRTLKTIDGYGDDGYNKLLENF